MRHLLQAVNNFETVLVAVKCKRVFMPIVAFIACERVVFCLCMFSYMLG